MLSKAPTPNKYILDAKSFIFKYKVGFYPCLIKANQSAIRNNAYPINKADPTASRMLPQSYIDAVSVILQNSFFVYKN
jgi:hypothetical protein